MGFLIAPIVLIADQVGGAGIIQQASGLTALIFGGLTVYVLWSGADFSWIRGALSVLVWQQVVNAVAWFFGDVDETTPYGTLALDTRTLTTTLDRAVDELALAAELDHPEYLCSSHILVDTAAEAEEIVTLLDEGADFATLAIERSGDGSAAIGGDLGCGPTIGYVSEFSDGAREAGSGNISSPVRSQFGWHVISVRTIGELTPENHPEMTEAQVQQALGSFEPLARDRIANDLGTEIVDAAWERVAAGHSLDERLGVWDSTVRFIAPPGAIDG